jgi:hypothetical protein
MQLWQSKWLPEWQHRGPRPGKRHMSLQKMLTGILFLFQVRLLPPSKIETGSWKA